MADLQQASWQPGGPGTPQTVISATGAAGALAPTHQAVFAHSHHKARHRIDVQWRYCTVFYKSHKWACCTIES